MITTVHILQKGSKVFKDVAMNDAIKNNVIFSNL